MTSSIVRRHISLVLSSFPLLLLSYAISLRIPWAPMKVIRFLIFTGGGLLVPALAALGLSAADAFVVDRLLGGWRPNQFVNGPLKGFARLD